MAGIPFGKYQLVKRLARGGMAEVFLARQSGPEGFQRIVALKRILPHLVDSADFVRMFLDEARLAAQLSHPGIVHIYDFGKVDEHYFIAMEYVDGVHAGDLIKHAESEPIPEVLVARIGADACAGLHYAHELREAEGRALHIVHRDVSPPNLLASYDGAVKLVDFGIAKAVSSIEETRPGVVKGKFAYMSPEQTIGQKLDGRSDVFSLAVVLWELLAGGVLVPRNDPVEGMRMIRDGRIPPIESERPTIEPALATALGRALKTRREERCTALELGRSLEEFIKRATEGIGSTLELAEWVRDRFPRESQSAGEGALHDALGTRPATGATRAVSPILGSTLDMPLVAQVPVVPAGTSGSGEHALPAGDFTSTRMGALRAELDPDEEDTAWERPRPLSSRYGQAESGAVPRTDFDAESSSVIVAPDWLVEEGPGFDTLAETRDVDRVDADPSETAETNDFRLQRVQGETELTRTLGTDGRGQRSSAAHRATGSSVGRKLARVALIVVAGSALGVGTTALWNRFGKDLVRSESRKASAVEPSKSAPPDPTVTPMPVPGAAGAVEPADGQTRRVRVRDGDDRAGVPRPPASGLLRVRTRPSSEVYLGNRLLGETPLVTELKPGRYTLLFKRPGQPTQRRTVTVGRGDETKLDFEL